MNRIAQTFQRLKAEGKKALIAYITPEFPLKGITVPLLRELEKTGADLIEVGIPFSDPLADGATIQRSSEVALKHGVNISIILEDVKEFREKSQLPIILMGYINPILRFGIEKFMKQSAAAGVDGIIIPDLPPEEAHEVRNQSSHYGISNIFLIAPTTQDARIQKIDEYSTDFSYCVSVTGVTGARKGFDMNGSLERFLRRVRHNAKKPFVVGFGISKAEHVQRVWQYSDGAVVGSALIHALSKASTKKDVLMRAGKFLRSLKVSEA